MAALEHWPVTGVPEKPGAWLMATAKRRALDELRRRTMLARKHQMLIRDLEQEQQAMPDPDARLDDEFGDELLRLIFTACIRACRARRAQLSRSGWSRPDHRRDRARLPAAGGDHRPAHRAREADAVRIGARLRNPARPGALGAARLGAGGRLPHLQRRLYGRPRRRMAAAAALQRRIAHGPRADTSRAAGGRSPRPARADGAERVTHRGAHRCGRRSDSVDGPEPDAMGSA